MSLIIEVMGHRSIEGIVSSYIYHTHRGGESSCPLLKKEIFPFRENVNVTGIWSCFAKPSTLTSGVAVAQMLSNQSQRKNGGERNVQVGPNPVTLFHSADTDCSSASDHPLLLRIQ